MGGTELTQLNEEDEDCAVLCELGVALHRFRFFPYLNETARREASFDGEWVCVRCGVNYENWSAGKFQQGERLIYQFFGDGGQVKTVGPRGLVKEEQ